MKREATTIGLAYVFAWLINNNDYKNNQTWPNSNRSCFSTTRGLRPHWPTVIAFACLNLEAPAMHALVLPGYLSCILACKWLSYQTCPSILHVNWIVTWGLSTTCHCYEWFCMVTITFHPPKNVHILFKNVYLKNTEHQATQPTQLWMWPVPFCNPMLHIHRWENIGRWKRHLIKIDIRLAITTTFANSVWCPQLQCYL